MDHYVLYLPFEFPINNDIKEPLPYEGELGGYHVKIVKNAPYYALVIEGLESEESAILLFRRLIVALHWTAIEMRTAVRLSQELQDVEYADDPVLTARNLNESMGLPITTVVDALIDGARPAIYMQEKMVRRLTGQPISVGLGYSPKNILDICNQGMDQPHRASIENPRLKLALDLYSYSKFEVTGPARFLVLCTVLEVLAPSPRISKFSEKVIDSFDVIIVSEMKNYLADSLEYRELLAIRSRLGNLKQESHTGRIKKYVEDTFREDNRLDSADAAKDAVRLYRQRGKLVHDGLFEMSDDLERLEELARSLLKITLRNSQNA
jgi:hypothetical protein